MDVWMLVVGPLLLAVVGYDAISTTLSTGAAAGPVTSRVGSGWWRTARRVASGPTSPLIAASGPIVVLLTVAVWLALLWGGWTLIFSADPDAIVSSTERTPAGGWSRVYYAAFSVFTLGVGDYLPNGQPWEVLTGFAVVTGLGLTTLAITYLVPVVSAVTARRVQANTIAGMGPSPQGIVIGAYRDGSFGFLDHRLPTLSDQLLQTAERHLSYPVLHYFHGSDRHVDLRVQLYALDEAVSILQHAVDPDHAPHPAVLDGVRHAVQQVIRRATHEPADGDAPAPSDLTPLREAGIPVVDDATFADRLAGESQHRRRLLAFARESLWQVPAPDPTSATSSLN